jgi:hypothetical protein
VSIQVDHFVAGGFGIYTPLQDVVLQDGALLKQEPTCSKEQERVLATQRTFSLEAPSPGCACRPKTWHTIRVLTPPLTPLRALHAETVSNCQQGNRLI